MTLLAVYGTLRTGHYNNAHCLPNSKSIGLGKVSGLQMHSTGYFPICCLSGNPDTEVTVEVFEVASGDLARCDRLEGHPRWYERTEVTVLMDDGGLAKAEIYLQSSASCIQYTLIPSGDWTKRKEVELM